MLGVRSTVLNTQASVQLEDLSKRLLGGAGDSATCSWACDSTYTWGNLYKAS